MKDAFFHKASILFKTMISDELVAAAMLCFCSVATHSQYQLSLYQ